MTSIVHLHGEKIYWDSVVAPLADHAGLRWEITPNLADGTIVLTMIHPQDMKGKKDCMSKTDVDRKKRSAEKILAEIETAISKHLENK